MALRFIFACMVVVALSLAAIPLLPAFNGIEDERATIIAAQQAESYEIAVPPQVSEESGMEFASEEDLSNIEPAAGDMGTDEGFNSYFDGQAPSALAEPELPEEANKTEASE